MSSFSAPRDPFRRGLRGNSRARALVPTIVVFVALVVVWAIFTNFWTERLWYQSVSFSSVFSTTLLTRIGLFVVFGVVMAGAVLASLWVAYAVRPRYRAMSSEQQALDRYRDAIDPHHKLIAGIIVGVLGIIAGWSASGRWSSYLQWRNAVPFGTKDPQFGKDPSFYLFGYPWYRFLIGYGFAIVVLALVVALIAHYLYGGIRLQTQGQKASAAAQAHVSVLLGLFVLLKAVAYWFDRYGLALGGHLISRQEFTGVTYTDAHAVLPAKTILTFIALICAVLFFLNVVRRTWLLPGLGVGLLLLSAVLLGWAWPAVVQQAQVKPNEPDLENAYIQRNINATRFAYGIGGTKVTPYAAKTTATEEQVNQDTETLPGIRLIDPAVVGRTFDQLQQVRGFYTFANPLDVDRYKVDDETRDAVVAVRELSLAGVPADQRNWNNDHTVFTHGYGMVASYGNEYTSEGSPRWLEGGIPPSGNLPKFEPRVYFGEQSPSYSIVGAAKGAKSIELDVPGGDSGANSTTTYNGKGGVPMGSFFNQMLYATKFSDLNILLSGRVNNSSKVLYDRHPRERVQKVAPWLSLDSNPYPAVVDGRVKWIIDGYTMSENYPLSQRLDLQDATSDSLERAPAIAGQPSVEVNYVRNSVKAVVDAYDGDVDLYAWDTKDPVLKTWQKAFPGTIKPKPTDGELLEHLRYPEDLMKLQREILAQYHVTNARTFYEGSERWRIPPDPTRGQSRKQPAYYLSVRMPDQDQPVFSLTSSYIYFNRQNMAAFVAVNADARSKEYGQIRILQLNDKTQIDGPNQVSNKLKSDGDVSEALLPLQRAGNEATYGNLLTLPIGGGLLYVQPVYVQASQGTTYPLLRLVLASSGGKIGVGTTLEEALNEVYQSDLETGDDQPPPDQGDDQPPDKGEPAQAVAKWLAEANQAFDRAEVELKKGNLAGYQDWNKKAQDAVAQALKAQQQADAAGDKSTPKPTKTPTTPTPTPTAEPNS
ncbi:UPF0182 family membrane protein [Flindersiella endophytica]